MIKNLSSSLEDYLETILELMTTTGRARVVDISKSLGVKKPSVTAALKKLAKKALIIYEPYQPISLTAEGRRIAKNITEKHEVVKGFLKNVLAVDSKKADELACSMEHLINEEIVEKVKAFEKFLTRCPNFDYKWVEDKGFFCNVAESEKCEQCVDICENNKLPKEKEKSMETLNMMNPGDKVKVLEISTNSTAKKRLIEMGIARGSLIKLEKIAPMNDPIDIIVKGYHLSIRRDEAENIIVKKQ